MNTHKYRFGLVFALTLAAALVTPRLAVAQIEEVLVTAQKRQESQQDVPISITAVTGEQLQATGIDDTDDLGFATPGLQMNQGGVANLPFIRGIGSQDGTPAQDNPVATYIDGVLQSSVTGSAFRFNNIERIEVLKGPQGTLFGRNTTGGVINVITKDPTQEPQFNVELSAGNFETYSGSLYGSAGVGANLAADVALYVGNQDKGFSDNLTTGRDANKRQDEIGFRSKWKLTTDAINATFIASYSEYSDDMGYIRTAPPGSRGLTGLSQPPDEWDFRNDTETYADFENTGVSLRLDKEFAKFDFLSITAWNKNLLDSFTDNDFAPIYFNNAGIDFYERTVTQEFQFLSNQESRLRWIAGLFYLDQAATGKYDIIGGQLQLNPPEGGGPINTLELNGHIESTSLAGFAEIAFDVSEQTRLTIGGRYTRDEREFVGSNVIMFGRLANPIEGYFDDPMGFRVTAPIPPGGKTSWSEPTYRVVLDHRFSDDVLVYGSYNRGFRSGNYITAVGAGPTPQAPFDPEFIDAFEVGVKSDLADGRVRLNASVYYYTVEDLQFQILQGVSTITQNAAEAEIKGAELDLTWQATDDLTFNLGASFVDGEYSEFPNAVSNVPVPAPNGGNTPVPISINATGNQIGGTPELMLTGALNYKKQTPSGEYSAVARVSYNDGYPWEPDGRLVQPEHTVVNLTFGWRAPSDKWGLRLIGKNLTDEYYSVTTRSVNISGDFAAPGPPRTFSVAFDYKFF